MEKARWVGEAQPAKVHNTRTWLRKGTSAGRQRWSRWSWVGRAEESLLLEARGGLERGVTGR